MPKTVDTRRHCKVGLRACNNLPQPNPYISVFWVPEDCCNALNPTFLVSTVFGTVSSPHSTSFLMIFTLVFYYTVLLSAEAHSLIPKMLDMQIV